MDEHFPESVVISDFYAGACKEGSRRLSKKGAIQNTDAGEREACSTYAGTGCVEVTDHHPVQG